MIANIPFATGLSVCGIILLFIGYQLRRRAQSFLESSVEVSGTVLCMESTCDPYVSGLSSSSGVLVSYTDDQGRLFTVHKRTTRIKPYEAGTPLPVYYQANNPQKARVGPRQDIFRPARDCIVAGIILLIFGAIALSTPHSLFSILHP